MKSIVIGDKTLQVDEIYPYRYDYGQGREVLRLKIARENHSYTEIEDALENPVGDIEYMEDGEEVNTYKGYNRDFKCTYQNGVYEVEIARISPLELEVEALKTQVAQLLAQ